nr:tetratricopeptide repeat protein [uncultured Campylobacter sp.]
MRRFILLAFFAALAFCGELADLRDECEKGNKEVCRSLSNAIKNLELACKKGGEENAMACAGLGYFYEFDKEFTKAVARYKKACELGADKACVYLGLLYQNGQGAAQDHKKANELFAKACEKDVAEGCASLAYSYGKGLGVYPNGKKRTSCLLKPAS